MTLLLGDADIRAVLEWRPAVAALRAAYAVTADGTRFPGRLIARGDGTFLHMPLTT